MNDLQQKLDFLLDKYSIHCRIELIDKDSVKINGNTLPLLPHRYERKFIELKNLVTGGTLVGISVMRSAAIIERGGDIYETLYRELDLCEYILQRKIKSVMVMENGNVLNAIARCEDGVVCTIEVAATLAAGDSEKGKHEIIAQRGTACDIAVDTQLSQDSVYVFGEENRKYTDVDFELYGLSAKEISVVRAAFAMAQEENQKQLSAAHDHLLKLVELAKKSAKSGEREVIE